MIKGNNEWIKYRNVLYVKELSGQVALYNNVVNVSNLWIHYTIFTGIRIYRQKIYILSPPLSVNFSNNRAGILAQFIIPVATEINWWKLLVQLSAAPFRYYAINRY